MTYMEVSFVYNPRMMLLFAALFVKLILLKIASASCTFSIGLGDMLNNGWQGSTVTVNSGGASSTFTRDSNEPNPIWHDFQVQPGDLITVSYADNGAPYPYLEFYSVNDGPGGSGNVMYATMPSISFVPNRCLTECDFFINLLRNDGIENLWTSSNYATIYLNGAPILTNLYIDNGQDSQIFSFGTKVVSTDVITVQRPDLFIDDMGYEVYIDSVGSMNRVYRLVNPNLVPPSFWAITNYCGLNDHLQLYIPSSQALPGSSIPVSIFKFIPQSNNAFVKVFLVCGSKVESLLKQVLTTFDFDIPQDFSGFCYFYSSALNYNLNKLLNSPNVLFYVGKLITPISGDVTFIPPQDEPEVARSISIPGSRFITV